MLEFVGQVVCLRIRAGLSWQVCAFWLQGPEGSEPADVKESV